MNRHQSTQKMWAPLIGESNASQVASAKRWTWLALLPGFLAIGSVWQFISSRFDLTYGLMTAAFVVVAATTWFLTQQPRRRLEQIYAERLAANQMSTSGLPLVGPDKFAAWLDVSELDGDEVIRALSTDRFDGTAADHQV